MEKITQRELQILEILHREPMLSQDDLAKRLQISRSAAAVHVSNLIRKGYILGRGYVFNDTGGIVVVGNCCLNVRVNQISEDTNQIWITWCGTAVELGIRLSQLGLPTTALTAVGTDHYGDEVVELLQKAGVDVLHILRSSQSPSAKKVIIKSINKEAVEFADDRMDNYLDVKYFRIKEEILRKAPVIVLGRELNREALIFLMDLAERIGNRVCFAPGALKRIMNLEAEFKGQAFAIVTLEEIGAMNIDDAVLIFQKLHGKGLKELVLVMDEFHLAVLNSEGTELITPDPVQRLDNLFDFLAGMLYGWLKGSPLRQAVRMGLSISSRINNNSEI